MLPTQTIPASVRLNGQITYTMYSCGTTDARFFDYLKNVLISTLHRGYVIVMDNRRTHHVKGIDEKLCTAGMISIYLLPYSPNLNPIEMMWSRMKAALRKWGRRITARLPRMAVKALSLVSPNDCLCWFEANGYWLDF